MTKTKKQIEEASYQFDAIIEALNDFYDSENKIIRIIDMETNEEETFNTQKLEDLQRLYINHCLDNDEDLWQSIENFISHFVPNIVLAAVFTNLLINDVATIYQKNQNL